MTPTRKLDTRWGTLHVVCERPDRVTCATNTGGQAPDSVLQIDGHSYTCSVDLLRCPSAQAVELGYQPIDATWCATSQWGTVKPASQETPLDSIGPAHSVLRYHVLPSITAWLGTADGAGLLHEGDTHWRTVCGHHADRAEHALTGAWQRLQQIRRVLAGGHLITVEDEQFLRHPTSDDTQDLRNRLDLELFEALKPWLPDQHRQPAVNALTDVVFAVLHNDPAPDQTPLTGQTSPCNVCNKKAEILDTEYHEYFCTRCAANYGVLDRPHRAV